MFLELSARIIKTQCLYRGHLQRRYNTLRGPGMFRPKLCVNDTDFLSGENISDIKYEQLYTFQDKDKFIYGFDLVSLYNLVLRSGDSSQNPYTRDILPDDTISNIKQIIKLSRILLHNVTLLIKEDDEIYPPKTLNQRIVDLFHNIDLLGNYSDPTWFNTLNKYQLIKFTREIMDIWIYRAQLSSETRINICPQGNPFIHINIPELQMEDDENIIKDCIVLSLEKMVNTGIDADSQSLGAYYVLGSLTLVNNEAAIALPWLYESMAYAF